jgi:hypothetical protein
MWGGVFGVKEYKWQATWAPHVGAGTDGAGRTASAVGVTLASHHPCGAMLGVDATYGTVALASQIGGVAAQQDPKFHNGTSLQVVAGWTWDVGITAQLSAGQSKCSDSDVCGPGFNGSLGVGYVF